MTFPLHPAPLRCQGPSTGLLVVHKMDSETATGTKDPAKQHSWEEGLQGGAEPFGLELWEAEVPAPIMHGLIGHFRGVHQWVSTLDSCWL